MDYFIDLETRSPLDIKIAGGHDYLAHPDAHPIILSIGTLNTDPALLPYHLPAGAVDGEEAWRAAGLLEDLRDDLVKGDGVRVWAHNAGSFEAVAWDLWRERYGWPAIPLHCWRDTAVLGSTMLGMPRDLFKMSRNLDLVEAKKDGGTALMTRFCVRGEDPDPSGRVGSAADRKRWDRWVEFLDYCRQDVRALQALANQFGVPVLERLWSHVNKAWMADVGIEWRGVPVDADLARVALQAVGEEREVLEAEVAELTGGISQSQVTALGEWLQGRGYTGANLQAATVEEQLAGDTLGPDARRVLEIRQTLAFAAPKKLEIMAASDGRVRGAHVFGGAATTGRMSGKRLQIQNFKRPGIRNPEAVLDVLRAGVTDPEAFRILWGGTASALSHAIRHFVRMLDGPIVQADYKSVEARILVWAAGQEDILHRYHHEEGYDPYVDMAAAIGPDATRQLGKQVVLGCGYQMGPERFRGTCANYGMEIDEALAVRSVSTFREVYDRVRQFWWRLDAAAKRVVATGKTESVERVHVGTVRLGGIKYLSVVLPSGRPLLYPHVRLVKSRKFEGEQEIQFWGREQGRANFAWVSTYGGKLTENIVQAIAADLLMGAMVEAEADGIRIVALVHDEILAEGGEDPEGTLARLSHYMVQAKRPWGLGIPLEVEGIVSPCYVKA